MLSTINMQVFEEMQHMIRTYTANTGYALETYNKSQFVKRYGISMYVPKENANLTPSACSAPSSTGIRPFEQKR